MSGESKTDQPTEEDKFREWWKQGSQFLNFAVDNEQYQHCLRLSIKFDVLRPAKVFTGRKKELVDLHEALQKEGQAVISQTSAAKLGGIGKTELARKYISEYSKDYDGNVIWINADNYTAISDSFRRLVDNKLKINTLDVYDKEKSMKTIIFEAYDFFAKMQRKCLFVFDDVKKKKDDEEGEDIMNLLPSGANKPHVIITSRHQQWENMTTLTLNVFTKEEANAFVRNSLKDIIEYDHFEIRDIAEDVQYLPYSLHKAVVIVAIENEIIRKWGKGEYLLPTYTEQFQKIVEESLGKPRNEVHDPITKSLITTWSLITDKIPRKIGGDMALEILNVVAFLAPHNIPIDDMYPNVRHCENKLFVAMELLDEYCITTFEYAGMNVHPLVQEITRMKLSSEDERKTLQKTYELLCTYLNTGNATLDNMRSKEMIPHVETFISHLEDKIVKALDNLKQIEENYLPNLITWMSLGSTRRKKEALERILISIKKRFKLLSSDGSNSDLKLDHLKAADTVVVLGNGYGATGNRQTQKDLLEWALEIKDKYDCDKSNVVRTLLHLIIVYGDLGEFQNQKKMIDRALPLLKDIDQPGYAVEPTVKALSVMKSKLESMTTLHTACRNSNLEMVRILMERGEDVLAKTSHDTVMHQAAHSNDETIVTMILGKIMKRLENSSYLSRTNEFVNAPDTEGDTPLMWACEGGHTNSAKLLLEQEIDLNVKNKTKGETALHWAAKYGHYEIVNLLLKKQANTSVKDNNGNTPIDLANKKFEQSRNNDHFKTVLSLYLRS